MRIRFVFAAVLLLIGSRASAQPDAPSLPEKSRRWAITADVAFTSSGPAGDLENAMRAAGYGQPSFSFLGSGSYPTSSTGLGTNGPDPAGSLRYSLNPHLAVGLTGGASSLGTTYGHAAATFVVVESSSTCVGALVFYQAGDVFRIGAGPAWYRLQMRQIDGREQTLTASRLGFVAEAGVTFPARTRVFGDLHVQYRGAGRADLGTFTPPPPSGSSAPSPPLPVNSMNFSHWTLGVGVGVRL